jgi:AcrR family transcriptional regulator
VVPPAAGPSRPAIGRTRDVLVAAAARAFADHGVRGATMAAVAASAGVAKGTLYNYFRTKDEIVRALVDAELARLTALAGALPREQALAALADEVGAHPVIRRLADSEPESLDALVHLAPEVWAGLTARLAAALGTDEEGAGLAARWLLGVLLQPGRSSARHRAAARLAAVLPVSEATDPAPASA